MKSDNFNKAVDLLTKAHGKDPNVELFNGQKVPAELLYTERIVECLNKVYPEASEELIIAGYCQHLYRWEMKRTEYPEGKIGYYKWRNYLSDYQASKAEAILKESGYNNEFIQQVINILKKLNIHRVEEAQMLEDAVCLVFLVYYMEAFSEGKTESALIQIVQKTWNKMSDKGHSEALKLDLPVNTKSIVTKALD